jgi:hypothetical protein
MDTPRDRRRSERREVQKACKVYHPVTRRYAPGHAVNISAHGALVRVEGWTRLSPGDPISLVIAWTDRPILPADAMVRGTVVRSDADNAGRQAVAVDFDQAVALAA